jgi:predicted ATPase
LPRRKARVIGRDADLEAIANQLTAQRFVSIVGSGGVGKTTVAAAIVRQISPEFEGNVVFLDLGMLNDPTLVVGALATAVGVAVVSGDPVSALQRALKEKRALLLLDGCEYVAEVAAALCEAVFAQCPNVHILTTSREPLRAASERVYRLGPLACPPDNPNLSATEILQFPAIQLFVERLGGGPASTPSDVDLSAIAIICRRLDGIPLALELAAGESSPTDSKASRVFWEACWRSICRGSERRYHGKKRCTRPWIGATPCCPSSSRPRSASFPYSRTRFRSMTSRPSSRDRTRPIRQNYSREWPS